MPTNAIMTGLNPRQRKRKFCPQMTDELIEACLTELNDFMIDPTLSPNTRQILATMHDEISEFKDLEAGSVEYAQKQGEILRSEQFILFIFQQDYEYSQVSRSYTEFLEQKTIILYGDYHKTNLNIIRAASRESVKEINRTRKEGEFKTVDLLGGRPWDNVLQELRHEESLKSTWLKENRERRDQGLSPLEEPKSPLTDYMKNILSGCSATWSIEQAMFEMSEYSRRNQIAHTGIDEIVAQAKASGDPNSEHWRRVAQQIINDKQAARGMKNWPDHLKDKEYDIRQTLSIFQTHFFDKLTTRYDADSIEIPDVLVVASRHILSHEEEHVEGDKLKEMAEAYEPFDAYEEGLKRNFLDACQAEEIAIQAHKDAQTAVSTAAFNVAKAEKEVRLARSKRKREGNAFLADRKWRDEVGYDEVERAEEERDEEEIAGIMGSLRV